MGSFLTQEEFINKAKAIHGDKYDYDESVYIDSSSKVKIICPIHGPFFQCAKTHISGHGCPECGKERTQSSRRLSNEDFINRVNNIHKHKYDYSLIKYKNASTKIPIICPIHGPFMQTPQSHLKGHGCPDCSRKSVSSKLSRSEKDFLEEANIIHSSKYLYPNLNSVKSRDYIEIICPEHGAFIQNVQNHLRGQGCPFCGGTAKITPELFLQKATKTHNNKYSYTIPDNFDIDSDIQVFCPEHGISIQKARYHLKTIGCPECSKKSRFKKILNSKNFRTSKPEKYLHKLLLDSFKGVKSNFSDDSRYPFSCDFYIPERDIFIELNAHWTHNPQFGWYNPRKKHHKEFREKLLNLSIISKFYEKSLEVWTERDVLKRKTAKKNNLNYVVLWNEQDIEDWFALGCPDGHDGDGMYTWKEKVKND